MCITYLHSACCEVHGGELGRYGREIKQFYYYKANVFVKNTVKDAM